jgi:hypothetical protein
MVSVAEVTDQALRQALAQAEAALDEGEYARSVRHCVVAYCRLIEQRPDMIIAPRFGHSFSPPQHDPGRAPQGAGGLVMGGPRPWPSDHGVRFSMEEGQKPTLTFSKERFTLSEAATYFEYTLDMVLRAQRHPT